jgi:hypothetical protein
MTPSEAKTGSGHGLGLSYDDNVTPFHLDESYLPVLLVPLWTSGCVFRDVGGSHKGVRVWLAHDVDVGFGI